LPDNGCGTLAKYAYASLYALDISTVHMYGRWDRGLARQVPISPDSCTFFISGSSFYDTVIPFDSGSIACINRSGQFDASLIPIGDGVVSCYFWAIVVAVYDSQ